jgi:xanthine dehydrogenase accessory factor
MNEETLRTADLWRSRGDDVALATVVRTRLSAPRPLGAKFAVGSRGEMAGSVSGGCVEGAVVAEALAILAGEKARGIVSFGYSDDEAFAVGLTCGGTIRLFVEPLDW